MSTSNANGSSGANGASGERKFKQVGTRPIRHDGLDKVTGRANFGADLALPGMLHGAIARSEHAHARIVRIDTSKAEALEGVHAVVTAADFPNIPSEWKGSPAQGTDAGELSRNILAREKVLYHGHALAAVAAVTPERAREAAELVEVEYEVLPPVLSLDDAVAPGAAILHENQAPIGADPLPQEPTNIARRIVFGGGDIAAGFADSEIVVEREFENPMVHQGYIEPHACVVDTREDGKAEIWCCTQGAFAVKASTAQVLEMDPNLLKVTPSEIGGGFGGKTTIYLEPVALVLSR
ncbi:MAG: molybdopterin cofactor-binding domain-containing protein, partial [Actinomycetota bacterium]